MDSKFSYNTTLKIGRIVHFLLTTPVSFHRITIATDMHDYGHVISHTHYEGLGRGACLSGGDVPFVIVAPQCRITKCGSAGEGDRFPVTVATLNIWNLDSNETEPATSRLRRLTKVLYNICRLIGAPA